MADQKISQLTAATSIDGTEVAPVVQSTTTKKTTIQLILDWILARANTFTASQTVNSNVVISDNSTSAALRVTQVGSGNALLVEDATNPDGSPFVVDSEGRVGVGSSPSAGQGLIVNRVITGSVGAYQITSRGAIQSDVTDVGNYYRTVGSTQAASFTLGEMRHYAAEQGTIGATSSVTSQFGFYVAASLINASNNYGVYSNIPSAAGRWNIYAAGTADNWFSGNVRIGGAGGLGYTTGSGGAQTQGTSRTTGVTLDKTNGAITLVSAAGSTSWQTFTVTNSTVAATDTIIVNQKSGTDLYEIHVTAVASGSFNISFRTTGGTTTEQPVFNFAVIKAVTS